MTPLNPDMLELTSNTTGQRREEKVHDQGLEIHAINGVAPIMQDDMESTYSACFEEGGKKACNFKP